ncbi:MAG: hypothetical protein LC798_13755 [Chloroflexi bacterium]|nr:hypothetical protein [Chloroflexota bacterium]
MTTARVPLRVRLRVQPFEFTMGAYAVVSGTLGLAGVGVAAFGLTAAVAPAFANFLNIMYAVAGLMVVVGVATGALKAEQGGLALLISGALTRVAVLSVLSLHYGEAYGMSELFFYAALSVAAAGRLHATLTDEVTVVLRPKMNGHAEHG